MGIALAVAAIAATWAVPATAQRSRTVLVTPEAGESHEKALYRYALDPDLEGKVLKLEARRYLLSSADGTSAVTSLLNQGKVLHPNARAMAEKGYVHLINRSLCGANVMRDADGHPLGNGPGMPASVDPVTETVIDGSDLVPELEPVTPAEGLGHSPVMRLLPYFRATGVTTIERVTFRNRSPPDPAGPVLDGSSVLITRCKIDSSNYGILAVNRGAEGVGSQFDIEISENIILGGASPGLIVGNFITSNASVSATISRNHVEGFLRNHLIVWNNGSLECTVHAITAGNRFVGERADGSKTLFGIVVANTRIENALKSGNWVDLISIDDDIVGHEMGIGLFGADNEPAPTDDNTAMATLVGTRFRDNDVTIMALGSNVPGSANRVRLLVRQVRDESGGDVALDHGLGAVEVVGSSSAWQASNPGLALPALEFFNGDGVETP